MERSSVSARIRLALKRQAFIAESVQLPSRGFQPRPDVTLMLSYMRPAVLAKSVRTNQIDDIAALRERFHQSRMSLYKRLVGLVEDEDCGCSDKE